MWSEYDVDGNNILDKNEAKAFIEELVTVIDSSRAKEYDRDNFDTLFEAMDEDQNGFLSKSEMSTLIKRTFRSSKK